MERQQGQGYVIVSKKDRNKEQTGSSKNNGKKNKKEEWEWQDVSQFQKMESNIPEKKIEPPGKDLSEEEKDKIWMEMCEILPQHSPKNILKCLRKYRYDMQETITHMTDQPEKTQQKPERSERPEKKMDKTQMAHNLLSQVCDQLKNESISGEEFERIFEDIAEMFREEEQEPQEATSFVDYCSSMKAALLVAFKEGLANYDDFQFDLQSPLRLQIQEFRLQANKRRHNVDKDFPALANKPRQVQGESIFSKHLKQEKKKQQQLVLFTPPKYNVPQFSQKKPNNSNFNVNKCQTQASLSDLHKRFSKIPIPWLKFVYKELQGNFNQCCEFFWKYYKEMCEERVIPVRRTELSQSQPRPRVMSNAGSMNAARKEQVDEEVRHMSLTAIRNELDYLYKLRQTMQAMKGKAKSGNQRVDLQRMINQKNPRINKLSRAARIREIQRMTEGDPLFIDLHGYRQQQIPPLFDSIARMLRENKWSERIKARKIDGTLTATFVAMTGKGLHSWGNRSVLKPAVQSWCARNGCKSSQESDRLRLLIPLQ